MPIFVATETSGMTEPSSRRIYLDANVFIYGAEARAELAEPIQNLFRAFSVRRGIAVTSELTLAEVLPKAADFQRRYYLNLIVWSGIIDLYPVSRDVLIETSTYRRAAGMPKLADAVHVVTAIKANCARVLSADGRIKLPEGMSLIDATPQNVARLLSELS
ncbi:type II toxin-antitoxin system VapC family toxin [Rubrivivax sp. JA1024]|nr:type II toxin-antitoxin system VapC family toxin [Rubrivivax sp. JA1024]